MRSHINELTRVIKRGGLVKPEDRRQAVDFCLAVLGSDHLSDRTKIAAIRAMGQMEASNLRDLHHAERLAFKAGMLDLRTRRAAEGESADCLAVQIPPAIELPLPDWMKDMQRRLLEPGPSGS